MARGARLIVLCSLAAASCGGHGETASRDASLDAPQAQADAAVTATLTVTRAGTGGGYVSSAPLGINCGSLCTMSVTPGAQVTLTAAPDASSWFLGWIGGGCDGTTTPCTATVTADANVQAVFAVDDSLIVTRGGAGAGTVTSSDGTIYCGTACAHVYPHGAMVTLTAASDARSQFTGWSGACSGTGACAVTVDMARMVTATFALNPYVLTVDRIGNGQVHTQGVGDIVCGSVCSHAYPVGTTVTLVATADTGSTFVGWSGGGCSGTDTCTVTMDAPTTVVASFVPQRFTLTVEPFGNGTGTVTSDLGGIDCGATCTATFDDGTVVTLHATGATGSDFAGWGGACAGASDCTVTIDAATIVYPTFSLERETLNVSLAGTGTGTVKTGTGSINCAPFCSNTFDYGEVVGLGAYPAYGSVLTSWSGGGCSGTSGCLVTMTAPTSVTATFGPASYTINITKSGAGAGTVTSSVGGINCGSSCSATFTYGTIVTFTATPLGSAAFNGWGGDQGCGGTGTCQVTVSGPGVIDATFN